MITTDEAKLIAEVLFSTGPKTGERVSFVCREIAAIPDAVRVNIEAVYDHLIDILNHERDVQSFLNLNKSTSIYDFESPLNSIG